MKGTPDSIPAAVDNYSAASMKSSPVFIQSRCFFHATHARILSFFISVFIRNQDISRITPEAQTHARLYLHNLRI